MGSPQWIKVSPPRYKAQWVTVLAVLYVSLLCLAKHNTGYGQLDVM